MICIIPARGGSTRIPRKNIKLFYGRPIISYSIETADKSGLFSDIVVSTEDLEISAIAQQFGAKIFLRKYSLAVNDIGTQEVVANVLSEIHEPINNIACCIYPCSPLLSVEDLRRGLDMLQSSRQVLYSYSTDKKGNDAGSFYWGYVHAFVRNKPLEGNSIFVPIECDRVCDINTPDDFSRAEKMYGALHGNK